MPSEPLPSNGTPAQPERPRFPGWVARLVIASCLLIVVGVRLLGRADDQPWPLDDPAMRNLLTLIFSFVAGVTLWSWFTFRSGYSLALRRLVFAGALAIAATIGIVLVSAGLTNTLQFSGSMVPRLAETELQLPALAAAAAAAEVDLTATTPDDFPQFLGPERSCWIASRPLAHDWVTNPPKQVWKRPIGAGWSAFAAANGFAVTLEQRGTEEWVACYRIDNGEPVWGHAIEARHENPLGGIGPRSTPTIHNGRVYALGATGVLRCLEGASGKLLWSDDLRERYGLTAVEDEANVMWGRAGSPLVIDEMVIVPAGGPPKKAKNLAAFAAADGKLIWEAENRLADGAADQIAYASPGVATVAGKRQILIVNEAAASGHDPSTGERLWMHLWPSHSNGDASSSQAVAIGTNQVLLSKGYSGGAELIEVVPGADGFSTKTVWRVPRVLQTKFTNVVIRDGHAFGLSEGILECVDLSSGKRKWKNGRYEHGQILGVGELLLALSEEGELHLLEANPAKFVHLASFPVLEGKTWNNLCLYGNKLLVRNATQAACYELP